jgi:starch synthase (maltosyl-transferring)
MSGATLPKTRPGRVVIEAVAPAVDCGRHPAKRVLGDEVQVEADCFAEGHDLLAVTLRYRHDDDEKWRSAPMQPLGNDRWGASFGVDRLGLWRFGIEARVDALASWRHEFARRSDPSDVGEAARKGADLVAAVAKRAAGADRARLKEWCDRMRSEAAEQLRELALDPGIAELAGRLAPRGSVTRSIEDYAVSVERKLARFSTWYELFPRSCPGPAAHGTFADVIGCLDSVAAMGFDVLYLPPIHPIGRLRRKGRNNSTVSVAEDAGSPWAIGSGEGGHKAIHPGLGNREDFRALLAAAKARGLEVALDIAFQCAPDHPYVTRHPGWFRENTDGSIQCAENPPKKYEDIYPFDFESDGWRELWLELESVIEHWIGEGVRLYRVDNPHTKPFAFWEWALAELKRRHPDVLFLAEAFTRPKVMHRLAKIGFSQSYTYFTWRETKQELTEYFTELAQEPGREYFRPNCWPNTPDILPRHLHGAPPSAFRLRLVLAATLAANYGIYGPAYELMENVPREAGSEEYLNSEKYQVRVWDTTRADSLAPFIARINRIRREHSALQSDWSLRFHATDNDQLLCYSKSGAGGDRVLSVVNLDARNPQSGWVSLDLETLGIGEGAAFEVHDLLSGEGYAWRGARNYVRLDPAASPAHVFHLPPLAEASP